MGLKGFDKDEVIDFVPEYGGNREDKDPTIVRLKFVPYSKVQHYARVIASRSKDAKSSAKLAEITQGVQLKQFVECVEGIENFSINGREVTDPAEFYDTADTELVIEIIRAMENQNKLTEGQRKNS